MIARALIVILAVLNLGVAAWWLLQPKADAAPAPSLARGVAPLEIVHTHAAASAAMEGGAQPPPAAPPAPAAAAPEMAPAPVCLRAGPFASRAEAAALQSALAGLASRVAVEEARGEPTLYRVILPPSPDRAVAEELLRRVQAAGFSDVMLLRQGEDANAVALGSYRNRDTAEARVQALRQAGFPAQLREGASRGASRWWLRLATAQPDGVRAKAPAARDAPCGDLAGTPAAG